MVSTETYLCLVCTVKRKTTQNELLHMEHRVVQRPVAEISAVAPTQQILVLMLFFLMNVVLAKLG